MDKQHIQQRKELLSNTAIQLKKEFIGLDKIIDEIIRTISSWYIFPAVQKRPLVINIWGLTGTGKTALVKRLVNLLEFNTSYLHLDMGEYNGTEGSWIKDMLTDDLSHYDSKQSIFCLDEFQFARTLDENQREMKTDKLRVIWELLDSGKIFHSPRSSGTIVIQAMRLIDLLERFERKNLLFSEGIVIGSEAEFMMLMERFYFDHYDRYGESMTMEYFLSKDFIEGLQTLYDDTEMQGERLKEAICSASLEGIKELVFNGVKKYTAIKQLDLSKALIFILGNLDEAFYMSHSINPDMNADYFSDQVGKITIAEIKQALQARFRNEQVARLGNNHVIYPAMNVESYRKFIQKQLERIADDVRSNFKVNMHFENSLLDLIYNEGVFPAQGTRPVFTTIRNVVESFTGDVLAWHFENDQKTHLIRWSVEEKRLKVSYENENCESFHEHYFSPVLRVHELRQSDNNDVQAHVAVHEAGHAIVAALALRILPSQVVSKTVSANSSGFCKVNFPDKMFTKELLRKDIMISLAGWIAERMVFGEECTSSGVAGDIEEASRQANRAVKDYAMGSDPVRISVASPSENEYFFYEQKHVLEAKLLIDDAQKKAEEILVRNKLLLLKMSLYLTENSSMDETKIMEFIQQYSVEDWAREGRFIKPSDYFKCKSVLLEQLGGMEEQRNEVNKLLDVANVTSNM